MAFNSTSAELLLLCRKRFPQALDFLMIGRQWLRINSLEARKLQADHGVQVEDLADDKMTDTIYAETLLQRLGLRRVEALDAAAYQGAGVVHDLNAPLGDDLRGQFDWVVDGGSLEHVFDFPTAIRNCAGLLRAGGLFISICPVNNWMGHGFYQFSPELFFRVFDEAHGFKVRFAALHVRDGVEKFYALKDPATVGHRVQHNPQGRTTLMFVAEKISSEACIPVVQQSDYSERWKSESGQTREGEARTSARHSGGKGLLVKLLPAFLVKAIQARRIQSQRDRTNMAGLVPCSNLLEAWHFWQQHGSK